MNRACAFCGENNPLTREHVSPKFLIEKFPEAKFGYHPKPDNYITWEATVADVCAKCNNEDLSELDSYGKNFFEKNNCQKTYSSEKRIRLFYSYDLLLRWLLKISYNAIRPAGKDSIIIRESVPFILKGKNVKISSLMFLEIIRNHKMTNEDRNHVTSEAKNWSTIPPITFRQG